MLSRRGLLLGAAAAAVTAPAIIRPGILMPVKVMLDDGIRLYAAAHPEIAGWSNLVTHDLTETSLLQLMIEIRQPRRGLRIRPRFIHT